MPAIVAFVRLSRLKFLTGGFLGVALGTLIARHQGFTINLITITIVQFAVTSFQLMTHYTNDYFDQEADALAVQTPFSGGSGVFARNELAPHVALIAAACTIITGMAAMRLLDPRANPVAMEIGIVIAALAFSYSSPPLRLLARGLGEFTTALVVAVLVPLLAFAAQTRTVDQAAVLSTLPAAFAMFIMMICVEIPDIDADTAAGKRNLVVRFGRASAWKMVAVSSFLVFMSATVATLGGAPWTLAVADFLPLPFCLLLLAGLRPQASRSQAWIASTGVTIFVLTAAAGVAAYLV